MEPGTSYETPAQSLYFREMARSKTTPKVNPRKEPTGGEDSKAAAENQTPHQEQSQELHKGHQQGSGEKHHTFHGSIEETDALSSGHSGSARDQKIPKVYRTFDP